MRSDISAEELAEAAEAMRLRMAQIGLRGVTKVETRTGTLLQMCGLADLTREGDQAEQREIATAAVNLSHASRIELPPGPLVALRRNESERLVVDIAVLLLAGEVEVREKALQYFEALGAAPSIVTPKAKHLLATNREAIHQSDVHVWGKAAVAVYDALRDDILLAIAGFRQSIELQFDDGISQHADRILRPAISSLDSIELKYWHFDATSPDVRDFIERTVGESPTLGDALSTYYLALGHVPLSDNLSAGALLRQWVSVKGERDGLQGEVWSWADRLNSPVARYHACIALLSNPTLVPEKDHQALIEAVAQAIDVRPSATGRWADPWRLRRRLAKHYCQHLECSLPGADSERIALFAWWLAERMGGLFDHEPDLIAGFANSTIDPVTTVSRQIWNIAHPMVKPSSIRYATLRLESMWSASAVLYLSKSLSWLDTDQVSEEGQQSIRSGIIDFLRAPWAIEVEQEVDSGYAFRGDIRAVAQAWMGADEELRTASPANSTIEGINELATTAGLVSALSQLGAVAKESQVVSAYIFMMKAYGGSAPEEDLWKLLSDDAWSLPVLLDAHDQCLDFLFDGLREITLQRGQRWAWALPHVIANACEKAGERTERQKVLFAMVILVSIAGNTCGGITRLLRGRLSHQLQEQRSFWCDRLREVMKVASPWVASRLRGALACLETP